MKSTLYYIHDPMCSWCWAFRPVWEIVQNQLPQYIEVKYLLGGLAIDTEQPMPESLQLTIRQTWKQIQSVVPGTDFNFDFWKLCKPRRSTYPACRAVIAAKNQGNHFEKPMILAIQKAYYLDAKNPSDHDVLTELASTLGLQEAHFKADLNSQQTTKQLEHEITTSRTLGAQGFPSLVWLGYGKSRLIPLDYLSVKNTLQEIKRLTQSSG